MDQHRGGPADPHPDLRFLILGPDELGPGSATGPDGEHAARIRGYDQAVSRAFLGGRTSDERYRHWLAHLRADAATLRGAWVADPSLGPGDVPAATFTGFDKTINVGGGRTLGLHMITDVSVSPAHRRRGLTRRLMTEDLAAAAGRGVPLAGLTVSEGSIYGRFGFGAATWLRRIEVAATSRFAVRPEVAERLADDPGNFELVEPREAWPAVREVDAAVHRGSRGSVERPHFYEPILTGALDLHTDSPDPKLRAVVHLDGEGRPDAYALYRPVDVDGDDRVLEVRDLLALDPASHVRLWRFLAEMDLISTVRSARSAVDDPLEHALVEPRAVRTVGVDDLLWLRVLDVTAALEARPWYAEDDLVLEVADPLDHAAGRWRLRVDAGVAGVTRTGDEPQVRLAADTLGSLYLGGVSVATLRAAGRVTGDPEAVRRLGRLADGGPAPHCVTAF